MMRCEEEYSRRSEASMVNPEIYSVVGSIRHKMFIINSKGTLELDDMISNKWHSDMYFLLLTIQLYPGQKQRSSNLYN